MGKLPVMRHPMCEDVRCAICLADHEKLGRYLVEATGLNHDHLGGLHGFMSRNGYEAETVHGWAHPDAFTAQVIDAYIEEYGVAP